MRFYLYKPSGPELPKVGEPQVPQVPVRSLCFFWFRRQGDKEGRRLEMFMDGAGLFWAKECGDGQAH